MDLKEQALKVAGSFPKSREAPEKLLSLINKAKGENKSLIGELVDVLYSSAENKQDLDLIDKYFGD